MPQFNFLLIFPSTTRTAIKNNILFYIKKEMFFVLKVLHQVITPHLLPLFNHSILLLKSAINLISEKIYFYTNLFAIIFLLPLQENKYPLHTKLIPKKVFPEYRGIRNSD